MSAYDVVELRSHFPALSLTQDGQPLAFFDGPGGTQVPQEVIDAVLGYYRESNANDGGAFVTSRRSDAIVRSAREALVDLLNARSVDEIKFGQNMTSLTFQLSRSIGATLSPGDEVIVTVLDHEANVSPWQLAAADRGAVVRTVDIHDEDGTLDLDDFDRKLTERTKIVALGYASNAIGTINPVADLVRRAHAVGALAFVDAVHFAPHQLIDVQALDADFLACSAYKFFGPHVGILCGRSELFDDLPAYKVRPARDRFQTGTQSFEGIAGTMAAVDYLAGIGARHGVDDGPGSAGPMPAPASPVASPRRRALASAMGAIRAHEMALFGRLLDGLAAIPGVRSWGITDPARFDERTPTAAITFAGLSAAEAAAELGRRGITAWSGHFYAQGLIERLGLADGGGVLRLGITHYNTAEEIDRLLGELEWIATGVPGVGVPSVAAG